MRLTQEKCAQVLDLLSQGLTHRKIAKELNVGLASVSRIRNQKTPGQLSKKDTEPENSPFIKNTFEQQVSNNQSVITTKSLDIKTVDEALEYSKVDLGIWEVDRYIINSWEVTMSARSLRDDRPQTYTNYQVKVWLKRKCPEEKVVDNLLKQMKEMSYVLPQTRAAKIEKAPKILEISLLDPHLGLRCFAPGADADWNMEMCENLLLRMVDELIDLAKPYSPYEYVLFPFGNDFLHSDNVFNTTTGGTPQPESEAWQKVCERAILLAIALIEKLRRFSKVKILVIPGNHARQTEFLIGKILNAYYHKNDDVSIDSSSSPYKFHRFGVNLIGFEHGHSIKQQVRLAALMANECQEDWAKTYYREWHLGDQHRKGSGRPSLLEEQGVSVEFLPGLTAPNEWHRIKSFNWQKRAGMAYVWHKKAGLIARLQVNLDRKTGEIMK